MELSEYIGIIDAKISPVKSLIISTLWNSSADFPKKWVRSSVLLNITGQKYFDRRIRELRDEAGLDIETQHIDGEHQYRLASPLVRPSKLRIYLSEAQKSDLFRKSENKCQICGKTADPGIRGLQADHKVPLVKGGSHDAHNWQALCSECNVAKRRACQDCHLQCNECLWAFPEQTKIPFTIRLDNDLFDQIQKSGFDVEEAIRKAILERK